MCVKALQNPKCSVCTQGMDKRVLAAAAEITAKKLANITLLGKPEAIKTECRRLGLDLGACRIVDHTVRTHD